MQLMDAYTQFINLYKGLSLIKKIIFFALIGCAAAGLILLNVLSGPKDNYQLLFKDLAANDAGEVVTKLKELKIPYRISEGGNGILVPKEKVYEVRMTLASIGLPKGAGVGFEIFDNTRLGMTDFTQNVNYQRALQGELARTIDQFAEVENARVHIVMAEKSLFIDQEQPASASVVLQIAPGKKLTPEQVQGIVHLVSSSVSGLKPERVTIVDNFGQMLAGFRQSDTSPEKISANQLVFKEKVERGMEERVRSMLDNALGAGKSIVRAACDLDFQQQEQTEERYLGDNQIIRSELSAKELSFTEETKPVGVPGVRTAGGRKFGDPLPDTVPRHEKENRTLNYEVGKLIKKTLEPVGSIKRISVAVLVDGSYRKVENAGGEMQTQYVPRPQEELDKLSNIIKSAVNFDANRGDVVEVVSIPFDVPTETPVVPPGIPQPEWMKKIEPYREFVKYAVTFLVALVVFFFIIRPIIRSITAKSTVSGELIPQLPKTVGEAEQEYLEENKPLPFAEQIAQLLSSDESKELMKSWLKQTT